jgi:hypothetical protein
VRWLGPFFLALTTAGVATYRLAARWMDPAAFAYLLWRSTARCGHADPRPIIGWFFAILGPLAVAGQFAARCEFTRFDEHEVAWRSWPWQAARTRPWAEVADLQLARLAGKEKARPHVVVVFDDGERVRAGAEVRRALDQVAAAAAFAAQRAGVPLRAVEREE